MLNLLDIKNNIESLPHFQQVALVEHLITNNIHYTENKNGIFLNISILNDSEITIVQNFINRINDETHEFNKAELIKQEFKKQLANDTPCPLEES